ncbi:hypothetical protein STENM327S_01435 [Streptomyces tendae]
MFALQAMPLHRETHPGLDGKIELLKFEDGTAVGRSDGAFNGRPIHDPRHLRILELRYGTIRAQALRLGSRWPSSEQLLEKHDPQGLRRGCLRTGMVQEQLQRR